MQKILEISPYAYDRLVQKHVAPLLVSIQGEKREFLSRKIPFFQQNSFQDYLAARVLLNSNLLLQGSILASTFVEKTLKAFILIDDETFAKPTHNCLDLYSRLVNLHPFIGTFLNKSFIEFLTKVYAARYYESLKGDFNIFISYRRTLAELDYTAFVMFNMLNIEHHPDYPVTNPYRAYYSRNDVRLFFNNYILGDLDKTFWIEEFVDRAFQLRLFSVLRNQPIECFGEGLQAFNDGVFDNPGNEFVLVEKSSGEYRITTNEMGITHKSLNKE